MGIFATTHAGTMQASQDATTADEHFNTCQHNEYVASLLLLSCKAAGLCCAACYRCAAARQTLIVKPDGVENMLDMCAVALQLCALLCYFCKLKMVQCHTWLLDMLQAVVQWLIG